MRGRNENEDWIFSSEASIIIILRFLLILALFLILIMSYQQLNVGLLFPYK